MSASDRAPMSAPLAPPRLSALGASAILLDAAAGAFDEAIQHRIWASAAALSARPEVIDSVPGMNNLMIVFDPLRTAPEAMEAAIRAAWAAAGADSQPHRDITIPVSYGGTDGPDLADLAAHCGLSAEEVIARHSAPIYVVAAIGAMPGFPYLSGLDPRLARPRRATPRLGAPTGAVMIGGAQAGIMPCTAPTGWHILGHTPMVLFDATRPDPATLRPGDRVRFLRVGNAP